MRKPYDGEYALTQGFGVNPENYARFLVKQPDGTTAPMRGHNGLDFKIPSGTTIKAPFNGKVVESYFDKDGYGNYIKIENETEGIVMAHMERILVAVGAEVKEGEPVAISDNTGYSTGPHLHIGYYRMPRDRANGYGGFIDPTPYIDGMIVPPVSGPLHSDNEYKACMADREKFWKERDEAYAKIKELEEELDGAKKTISGFEAIGFKSVDDVNTMVTQLKETNEKQQIQLIQVEKRNKDLADMVAKKEEDDYTAIEEGIKAARERDQLKAQLAQVKSAAGIKGTADVHELIDHLLSVSATIRNYLAKRELSKKTDQTQTNEDKKSSPNSWLFLGLGVLTIAIGVSIFFIGR